MRSGTIKNFLPDRGFGFIIPSDGGADVFFHVTQLVEGQSEMIEAGDLVDFELGESARTGKPEAKRVAIVGQS